MGNNKKQYWDEISRRKFIISAAKGIAAGTGMLLSSPFIPLEISGLNLNASTLEWRNKRSSMGYRRLGKTNIMVSEISFGCGINYGCHAVGSELNDTVRKLYDDAFDAGINFFDTTTDYKSGYTREECFQHFKPVRDNVFLATKVDDFEPLAVRKSIERSLKRMKTDYIDIIFLHNMKNRGGWNRGVRALEEIRKMINEGKVRFAGVSDHSYDNLIQVGDYEHLVDVILLKYSAKLRKRAETILLKANSLDIGTIAMKVFNGAFICWQDKSSRWEDSPDLGGFVSKGFTLPQAAIRFVLDNKNLSSALIGMQKQSEIIENVKALAVNKGIYVR